MVGKTWMGKFLEATRNAFYIRGGKHADIAYAYNKEPVVVFDFAREQEEKISYGQIEKFKDGRVFSAKYESEMKRFKDVKVIVFSNFKPDMSKLSKHRWVVMDLGDEVIFRACRARKEERERKGIRQGPGQYIEAARRARKRMKAQRELAPPMNFLMDDDDDE